MDTKNQGRGRPQGSTIPAERRRQRKDYRFSPTALREIAQGRALLAAANENHEVPKETAFLEAAITHYVAFLAGNTHQEMERLQAQITDLERALDSAEIALNQAQAETRLLKKKPQHQPIEPAKPVAYADLHKAYGISMIHADKTCPTLPDGFQYINKPESGQQCPVHEVFSLVCPVARARREVERLKTVPGITRIWLTKGGYELTSGAGHPTDRWSKKGGVWSKEE